MATGKLAVESASKKDNLLEDSPFENLRSYGSNSLTGEVVYKFDESQKLGITSSIFLILNKMIGTGSMCYLPMSHEICINAVPIYSIFYALRNLQVYRQCWGFYNPMDSRWHLDLHGFECIFGIWAGTDSKNAPQLRIC